MESALCGRITGLGYGVYLESIVRFQLEVGGQKTIYAQFVFLVIVGCVLVVGMLGDVIGCIADRGMEWMLPITGGVSIAATVSVFWISFIE